MSTEQHLAQYGVSIAAAKNFILLNLNRPDFIFSTAQSFGITNEMLGDIYGGASKYQVVDFFRSQGIDSTILETDPESALSHGMYFYGFERSDAIVAGDLQAVPDHLYIEQAMIDFQVGEIEGRFDIANLDVSETVTYSILFDFNNDAQRDMAFNFSVMSDSSVVFSLTSESHTLAITEAVKQNAVQASIDVMNDQLVFSVDSDDIKDYLQATNNQASVIESLDAYSSLNVSAVGASTSSVSIVGGQVVQESESAYFTIV